MGAAAGNEMRLLHLPYHSFIPDMDAFIAQLGMDARTAIAPLMVLINTYDLFAQFAIFSLSD
jgi:hypothetical protein